MRSNLGFPAAVCIFLAFVAEQGGCSSSAKQKGKPANGASATSAAPSAESPKANFTAMPAADFAKELAANESTAAKKYKDKDVILVGKVLEKRGDPDKSGGIRIIVAGTGGEKPVDIRVELAEIDHFTLEQFKAIKPGDDVKVKASVMQVEISRQPGKHAEIELNVGSILP